MSGRVFQAILALRRVSGRVFQAILALREVFGKGVRRLGRLRKGVRRVGKREALRNANQ